MPVRFYSHVDSTRFQMNGCSLCLALMMRLRESRKREIPELCDVVTIYSHQIEVVVVEAIRSVIVLYKLLYFPE